MSYRTRHSLDTPKTINNIPATEDEIVAITNKANEISDKFSYALGEDIFEGNNGECEWYDCKKDMIELSEAFPEFIFTLYCEGEEIGNLWIEYYMNGKVQVGNTQIIFDSFDISKLLTESTKQPSYIKIGTI